VQVSSTRFFTVCHQHKVAFNEVYSSDYIGLSLNFADLSYHTKALNLVIGPFSFTLSLVLLSVRIHDSCRVYLRACTLDAPPDLAPRREL